VKSVIAAKYQISADAQILGAFDQLGKAQDILFNVRDTLSDLQDENRTLKDKVRDEEGWNARAAKYRLVIAPGNATVWHSTDPIKHYACPVCFEAKQIHILQDTKINGQWQCPSSNCKAFYSVDADD
jgi:hypothetical protein